MGGEGEKRGSKSKTGEEDELKGWGVLAHFPDKSITGLQVSTEGSCKPWLPTDRTTDLQYGKLKNTRHFFPFKTCKIDTRPY